MRLTPWGTPYFLRWRKDLGKSTLLASLVVKGACSTMACATLPAPLMGAGMADIRRQDAD